MKKTIQLGLLAATNIGVTFLFQWYVLTQLGPGVETDALFAGMTIPQLVLAVISGSLVHVLVPLLSGENKEQLRHNAWCFLVLVGGLFTLLAVGLYVLAPWWVPITVPGFNDSGQALTIKLTRIQLVGMVFTAVNGVQWATYYAKQQYLRAEFTPLLASILTLFVLIWALPRFGIVAAAWVSTLRMGLQTLFLSSGMGRPVRPQLNSPTIHQAWKRIKPLLLGTMYYKTDLVVDRFLLSSANSGTLSLFYLSQQIYGAVSQILNKAISAPLVPMLSTYYKNHDEVNFKKTYNTKLIQVSLICIFLVVVLVLFGEILLKLLVGYGNITENNIISLYWILICLCGMFIGGVCGQISTSFFYSRGNTIVPTRVGIYSYTIYLPLKIFIYYKYGIIGIAITISFFYLFNFLLQNFLSKRYF